LSALIVERTRRHRGGDVTASCNDIATNQSLLIPHPHHLVRMRWHIGFDEAVGWSIVPNHAQV
jgi:hypothetical protein